MLFQSTPTYGGRQDSTVLAHLALKVSIHAHVRWATRRSRSRRTRTCCFNPRPRTVGDSGTIGTLLVPFWFQSTPTYGGRPSETRTQIHQVRVSIHAHVRWATCAGETEWLIQDGFQSTPTYGGRRYGRIEFVQRLMFQSTPTYGGRQIDKQHDEEPDEGFNPRPRTVGDANEMFAISRKFGFQSTPTYGGRRDPWLRGPAGWCFNPRPRTVGDAQCGIGPAARRTVSIHAHVRWATISAGRTASQMGRFQSTSTYGGRPIARNISAVPCQVSIHAHVRWATVTSSSM